MSAREGMEPDATGVGSELAEMEGFYQPTAMFDRGEFLGELADLMDGVPDTRAAIEAEDSGPKGFKLFVVEGADLGMEWAFKKADVLIGRGAENDLDFSDIGVSRHHARIELEGRRFYLSDLGSNNGTVLNGQPIEREVLSSGDEIVIGGRTLRFVELSAAPPTAAAHPVAAAMVPEPARGRASEIVSIEAEQAAPSARVASEIKVEVADEVHEPEVEPEVPVPAPSSRRPGAGTALKLVALILLVLLAVGYGGYRGYLAFRGESRAERELRAKRHLLEAIELVKLERFGDARILLDRALEILPSQERLTEYRAHCEREIGNFNALSSARELVLAGRWPEAVSRLDTIDKRSAYFERAQALREDCMRKIATEKLREARRLLAAGDLDGAEQLAREALVDSPGLPGVRELLDEIGALRNPKETPKPKAPDIPPLMERAVGLYKNDQILAAIDAAEAAGGADAARYMEWMRQVRTLVDEAAEAHRLKAAAEVLRVAPRILDLDLKIAKGQGKVRTRVKGYYADALYLKGLEAVQEEDYPRGYKLFEDALRAKPGHQLSTTRISELSVRARELYYQGYVLKDSNPDETRKVFRRVTQMTPESNQFHRWAAKWLAANP